MKLAIMQPYAFPYLGYFQLIAAVDRFVLLDDAAFIKRGWVNRNVLADGRGPRRFTIPVSTPKQGQLISTVRLHDREVHQRRLLTTIHHVYSAAPFYRAAFPVLERAVRTDTDDLCGYLEHTLRTLTDYLEIRTPIVRSSECHAHLASKGQDRIIEICLAEGASIYINSEGGRRLYDGLIFTAAGIDLHFLIHKPRIYPQNVREFIPRLSIIDAMMFNSRDEIACLLKDYSLVRAGEVAVRDHQRYARSDRTPDSA